MDLSQIKLVTEYEIVGIDLEEASVRHLADLGIKIGSFIQVISKTNDTAILLVRAARIALDNSILEKLDVLFLYLSWLLEIRHTSKQFMQMVL